MPATLFADLAGAAAACRAPPASIRTQPFLHLVAALLPVLAALGRGLAPARADVAKNLARLEAARTRAGGALDADVRLLASAELAAAGGDADALDGSTAAKGLLWLVRTLAWVRGVVAGIAGTEGDSRPPSLTSVARDAYASTLRPFHGPLTGAAVSAALAFAPGRAAFWWAVAVGEGGGTDGGVTGGGPAAAAEVAAFLAAFDPTLADLQAFLRETGLDDPTPVR